MCGLLFRQHNPSCDDHFAQRKQKSTGHLVGNCSFVVSLLCGEHGVGVDRCRHRRTCKLAKAGWNVAGNVRYLPLLPSLLRSGRDQCPGVFNCSRHESQIGEYSQLSACYAEEKARKLGHEFRALRPRFWTDPRLYFSTPHTYSELTASRFNQAQEMAISGENGRLSLTLAPCASQATTR